MSPFAVQKRSTRFVLISLALLAGASHAQALEGKALFEKLLAEAGPRAISATYGNISETSGDTFVAQNVTLTVDGRSQPITIEALSMKGLKEVDDRVTYEAIAVSQMQQSSNRGSLGVGTFASTNGDIPVIVFSGKRRDFMPNQVVKFGNFAFSDVTLVNNRRNSTFTMQNMAGVNGVLPLVYDLDGRKGLENTEPLQLETFTMNGLSGTGNGSTITLSSVGATGLNFPTNTNASPVDFMAGVQTMSMQDFTLETNGQQIGAMKQVMIGVQKKSETEFASQIALDGLTVNLTALPDPKARETMANLGYETLEGSMGGTSTYNLETGLLDLSDLNVDLKDMFKLSTTYRISGYTLELAQQIQKTQLEAQRNKQDGMALLMAMMPYLTQLNVDQLELSLTDQSLVGKLLDFQGKQMGTSGEQLAAGAPMMLGMGMAGLGMPALTEMVTSAVGKFLQTKGTLTASVKPSKPVSVGEIMMTSQTDPKKLPEMLNLNVVAD